MPFAEDNEAAAGTAGDTPRRWRRRTLAALAVGAALVAFWVLSVSTLSLGAASARGEIEARLGALTGQPVHVGGATQFEFFPSPTLKLERVRLGGAEPGPVLAIDEVRAELDLLDALFGQADIARLILIRPKLTVAQSIVSADDALDFAALDAAFSLGHSLLERFEGVRRLELWDGTLRPHDTARPASAVNLRMDWSDRAGPVRLVGSAVWNGQSVQIDSRLADPLAVLEGGPSAVRLSLASPVLQVAFEGSGEGTERDTMRLDGTLRLSTPSPERAMRWLDGDRNMPDIGPVLVEARLRHEAGGRTTMDPVTVGLDGQTGTGVLEAVFQKDEHPAFSGTLAFPQLELSRFAHGIAPLPSHPLDLQRPMAVSFLEALDLDLRLSALDAGFGAMPLRQLAATLRVSGAVATLDVGDAELLGGRAQGRLRLDLSGARAMALGRIDLSGVDAAGLADLARIRSLGFTGRADVSAQFEAPATSWGDVLRENASSIRLSLADGAVDGLSSEVLSSPGDHALSVHQTGSPVPLGVLEALVTTRGPYATLDSLRIDGPAGLLEASGFLSFLDDRLFVDGLFRPLDETTSGNDPFTTSQPIPFKIQGEWPTPTLTVGARPGMQPI